MFRPRLNFIWKMQKSLFRFALKRYELFMVLATYGIESGTLKVFIVLVNCILDNITERV